MNAAETPWLALALNNAWANATLYATLAKLEKPEFTAPRQGFFPSLAQTMNHVYQVDLYYLDALEEGGLGRTVFDAAEVDDPQALGALQSAADMRFAQFCNGITPETLTATRITERKAGPVRETVANLILHLAQHQVHHRGQAHNQLSQAGVAPPQLDDFFLDFDRVPSAAAYWG